MDYLIEIKQFHAEHIEKYKGKPVGCTEKQIVELESKIGYPLPDSYRQYLQWMGKDYRGIFMGSDWFIEDVIENTEYLPDLLKENKISYELPKQYLVFFSHQGYMAAWFSLPKESENPTVYFFTEGNELASVTIEGKFTDFLFKDMQGLSSCLSAQHKEKKQKKFLIF